MKKNRILIFPFMIMGMLFMLLFSCKKDESSSVKVPVLTTNVITDLSGMTATCGGNITSDGGATVTARGVCWSTGQSPTISDSKTSDGTGAGSFTSAITGLSPTTAYFVRAYATNSTGTGYGSAISFTTLGDYHIPELTTIAVSDITITTAMCGGNITSDGGSTVTARGVCWSLGQTPTITDSKTTDGAGAGTFVSSISDLIPNTTYYARAYATNVAGTAYGSAMSFTTQEVFEPVVTTNDLSDITQTTATSGGNVNSDGGSIVTARGVCWSTMQTPTVADSKTTDGDGEGSFSSAITDLNPNTTYYLRAYATNKYFTGYGIESSFSTLELSPPVVITTFVSELSQTSATFGGEVTSDEGSAVTERGVCWSTEPTPTITDSKTIDGAGIGFFTSFLTGLIFNTQYYVRAYASNSYYTGYGNIISFRTFGETVTDIDGNVYNTIMIGTQVWMVENLKTTRYNDGTSIPNSINQWAYLTTGAYCNYNNDENNSPTYGKLYNWFAVSGYPHDLAPVGWHIPTDDEWTTLATYLGGQDIAGSKLKETGTTHWVNTNSGATNESGFMALPAGERDGDNWGDFYSLGFRNFFWSSTSGSLDGFGWNLIKDDNEFNPFGAAKTHGFSVRCIKDN